MVLSEELSILESCCLKLVSEELIVRRFADIQEICFRAYLEVCVLNPAMRSGERCNKAPPVESGEEPWLQTYFWHILHV